MNLFDKILPPKKYILNDGTESFEKRSPLIIIAPIIILLTYYFAKITNVDFPTFFTNFSKVGTIIKKIFNPNFQYLPHVYNPLIETIQMSFIGSFLGAITSLPFAYLAAENMIKNKTVNWFVRLLFSVLRTMPTIVNALIATFIFGIGSLAGTVAIFIYSFSYVGKITYENIENINTGAFEALISMGFTRRMAFIKAILPEVLSTFYSTALYNFEGNVRYAAILGYVGAGGIGLLMNEVISYRQYEELGTILLCLFIAIVVIENISIYIRKKLVWGWNDR